MKEKEVLKLSEDVEKACDYIDLKFKSYIGLCKKFGWSSGPATGMKISLMGSVEAFEWIGVLQSGSWEIVHAASDAVELKFIEEGLDK